MKAMKILKQPADLKKDSACNHVTLGDFCINCGVIIYLSNECIKPTRYQYLVEAYPLDILKYMKINTHTLIPEQMCEDYLNQRSQLVLFIKQLTYKLNFRSQTYFLAVYYMDILFNKGFKINNDKLEIVAVACLLIASKFDENDPNIPDLYKFQSLATSCSKTKFYFTLDDLRRIEVQVMKALEYKLNYFTVYHFLIYFFTHGIVFKEDICNLSERDQIKKVEKVYTFARDVLDTVTEKGEEIIYQNNLSVACSIILYTRESILSLENFSELDLFKSVYEEEIENYYDAYVVVKSMHDKNKNTSREVKFNSCKNIPIPIKTNRNQELSRNNNKIELGYMGRTNSMSEINKPRSISLHKEENELGRHYRQLSNRNFDLRKPSEDEQYEKYEEEFKKVVNIKHIEKVSKGSKISSRYRENKIHDINYFNNIKKIYKNEYKKDEKNENEINLDYSNVKMPSNIYQNYFEKEKDTSPQKKAQIDASSKNESMKNLHRMQNEPTPDKNDLVQKTKIIFGERSLMKNKIQKQLNIDKNNPKENSTIIINNNINIKTFINAKDYIQPYVNNISSTRNDTHRKFSHYEFDYDKYSSRNESSSALLKSYDEKDDIRKKIDNEIMNRNKGYSYKNSYSYKFEDYNRKDMSNKYQDYNKSDINYRDNNFNGYSSYKYSTKRELNFDYSNENERKGIY